MSKQHSILVLAAALMILPAVPRSAARISQALCARRRQQRISQPTCRLSLACPMAEPRRAHETA